MLVTDLARWLDAAQRAPFTKNKVRKDLWSNFVECIHYNVPSSEWRGYTRIPRAHFITLQSFCMRDGKGSDSLNDDQLLSFITTLDDLRVLCAPTLEIAWEAEHSSVTTTPSPRSPEHKHDRALGPPSSKKKARSGSV